MPRRVLKGSRRMLLAVAVVIGLVALFLRSLAPVAMHAASSRSQPDRARAERLRRHVRELAGRIGERNFARPQALAAAERYVRSQLSSLGYDVRVQEYEVRPPGSAGPAVARNFEVVVPGARPDAPVLVLGAHYDSALGTPGADDNASGVAVLLELARALRRRAGGAVEVRLVAYGTEEEPYFWTEQMGSLQHARALKKEGRAVLGMASLEMLGVYDDRPGTQNYPPIVSWFYPDTADFLGVVGTWGRSAGFLERFGAALQPPAGLRVILSSLPRIVPEIGFSDHWSYWKQGFPAVMVTDTSFMRYADYHTARDLPERLDYERLADAAAGVEAAVLRLLSSS